MDSPITVAIVEDDDGFRRRFEQIFAQAPARYRVASAAASVAAGIEAVRANIDLLVVDLGLPDGDGIAVIRECKRLHRKCDVIVVTVFGDEEHVVSAIEAGASGYLLKDCNSEEFLAAIEDLLAGGSPVSPMVARVVLNRMRRAPEPAIESPALSEREVEILTLVAKGFSFADICRLLSITNNTVKTHVNRIYRKLAVSSRGQAVYEATQLGIIEL